MPKEVMQTRRGRGVLIEPLEPDDSDEGRPLKRKLHSKCQLRFVNKVCETYYTWDQIKADEGDLLKVALFDENNTKITSGPLSSASVEVVALHGDFNCDGQDYWTSEEFDRSVVSPPPGEEASSSVLGGDRILVLVGGEACLGDAFFQTTSFCARTGKFKMGVMLASAQDERVHEGISEPLRVMDNRVKGFNPAAATLQFPRNTVTEAIQQQASKISHLKARSAPCMSILPAAQHTAAMAGLGVLEARTTTAQQKQQQLRPTEVPASRTPSPVVIRRACMSHKLALAPMLVPSLPSWSFLQRCFLCQRELTEGMDIYIYRGDRAFCSKSCRCRHMTEDDSSAIDSGRVTAPDRFHRPGSCYKATPSVYFFLECRQLMQCECLALERPCH
ncbi:unnamed protein product [Miscanthus lutarioriparius]|uniref:FLZ-type domain-containing protein n=1 Tax=Miscanthus lutarioriparius TaxID=422564 RepID=A0A811PWJ7_9POAL|nr:unnamed protein product [Miscanthus lutarioriparius]